MMREVISEAYPVKTKKKKPAFEEYVGDTAQQCKVLDDRLRRILEFRKDLESEVYKEALEKLSLVLACQKLEDTLSLFLKSRKD